MKKITYRSLIILIIAFGITGFYYINNSDGSQPNNTVIKPAIQKVSDLINTLKNSSGFDEIKPFSLNKEGYIKYGLINTVNKATVLKINPEKLSGILNSKPDNITLEIPVSENKSLYFELFKAELFSPDFKIKAITSSGEQTISAFPGIHYRGIIKGDNKSIASFSFFNDRIMGIFSDESGNYNVGLINQNGNTADYMLFNENNLPKRNPFDCKVDDYNAKFRKTLVNESNIIPDNPSRLKVRLYYVADYKMYQDFNSSTSNVSNYITGAFNNVAALYQNEYLPLEISQISVYTTPDPYRFLTDSYQILLAFGGNTRDNFTGDLAQLLSTRQEGFGGIAWIGTLCHSFNTQDSSGRYSFCGIDTSYFAYPTYSWTITVMAHELGHNFGSMHTHACWWPVAPNKIGAIDSCYYAEGNCYSGTYANYNGTLMSYCHLNGATRLSNGFGPMPGDTVRLRYNQATCFGPTINSSEAPTVFALMQNYPNPFNPGTNIQFDVPQNAQITIKVYDVNGREIAQLKNKDYYSPGIYFAYFNTYNYSLSSGVYFYSN
jgi:hypothetical protein